MPSYDAKSPWAFRGRVQPVDIVTTGGLTPGARVKLGSVELEVLDVEESRTDDELVSASLRGAFADLALGAGLVSATAKAGAASAGAAAQNMQVTSAEAARKARKLENKAGDIAGDVARVAAIAAVIGSLGASSEQRSEVKLRATAGDRTYRATCASTDKRSLFDPDGRPSLSCAIVPVVEDPARHWVVALRTPGGALDVKRLNGSLEAHTAKGRDDSAPIFRIASTDTAVAVRADDGTKSSKFVLNAFVEVETLSARIASIELPANGGGAKAWLDTSSLADAEARDLVLVTSAIVGVFDWSGLRQQER